MEESGVSYFDNPVVLMMFGIPLLFIFAFFIYYFTRWVFSVRKQIVLMEGIYEKMGGDVEKLYAEKIKSPFDMTGTSFDPKNPQ